MRVRFQMGEDDWGWIVVIGTIAVVEAKLPRDRKLSHAFARYNQSHPLLAGGIALTTIFHLMEWLPPGADPFHRAIEGIYFVADWLRRQKIHIPTPTNSTATTGI